MAKKRKKHSRKIIVIIVLLLFGSGLYLILSIPDSPDLKVSEARIRLADARVAQADVYAPDLFNRATSLYDSAISTWQNENQRFMPRRDYATVVVLAEASCMTSTAAIEEATKRARDTRQQSLAMIERLQRDLVRVEKLYASLPLKKAFREGYNRSRLMLEEARIARDKKEYQKSLQIVGQAAQLLDKAEKAADHAMQAYFDGYHDWHKTYSEAVTKSSRNKSVLIVVEKLQHRLLVYKGGRRIAEYPAEFGPNWLGDKNHQGDKATPEGSYLVTHKKEGRQTKYYKALLLNYPNHDDLHRYKRNVKEGRIPKHIDVGGLIEIHGHGGRGAHWTDGCVALKDKDMDAVYRHASVNTPVIILGSLLPREEWEKQRLELAASSVKE